MAETDISYSTYQLTVPTTESQIPKRLNFQLFVHHCVCRAYTYLLPLGYKHGSQHAFQNPEIPLASWKTRYRQVPPRVVWQDYGDWGHWTILNL